MSRAAEQSQLQRLAYRPGEAPAVLGVSDDFFRQNIAPHLMWVRVGAVKLVAHAELERWLVANSASVLGDEAA
jgi:hypothetical protein